MSFLLLDPSHNAWAGIVFESTNLHVARYHWLRGEENWERERRELVRLRA